MDSKPDTAPARSRFMLDEEKTEIVGKAISLAGMLIFGTLVVFGVRSGLANGEPWGQIFDNSFEMLFAFCLMSINCLPRAWTPFGVLILSLATAVYFASSPERRLEALHFLSQGYVWAVLGFVALTIIVPVWLERRAKTRVRAIKPVNTL